jgi:hypothetical protein
MLLSVEKSMKELWHPVGMPLSVPRDASLRDAEMLGVLFPTESSIPDGMLLRKMFLILQSFIGNFANFVSTRPNHLPLIAIP